MVPTDTLLGLAPTRLPSYRSSRYDGSGFSVSLADLATEDRERSERIYADVQRLYHAWLDGGQVIDVDALTAAAAGLSCERFLADVQALGKETLGRGSTPLLAKIFHDLRSGALTGLVGYSQLLAQLPADQRPRYLQSLVFLARDQAKIARNVLHDIDPEVRAADEREKYHSIDDFIAKWDGFVYQLGDRQVKIAARSTFTGFVTDRCLETSAIDRVLYNYLNNAARFAADDQAELTVLAIDAKTTRWVVLNRLTADHEAWLEQRVGSDLGTLFRGGHTRGGHGIGLAACTDVVAASFGLGTADKAIDGGYVGARVIDGTYHAWFHWPAYLPEG